MAYIPLPFSGDVTPENIHTYLERELIALARSLQEQIALELRPVYAEPSRLRNGMIVYADGTSWNPGSGEGVYAYENGSWSKL